MQGFEFSGVKRWGLKIEPGIEPVIATSVDCLGFVFSRMRSRRVPVLKVGVQGSNG